MNNDDDELKTWVDIETTKLIYNSVLSDGINILCDYNPATKPSLDTYEHIIRSDIVSKIYESNTKKKSSIILYCDDIRTVDHNGDLLSGIPSLYQHSLLYNITYYKKFKLHNLTTNNIEYFNKIKNDYDIECDIYKSSVMYFSGKYNFAIREIAKNHEKITRFLLKIMDVKSPEQFCIFNPIVDKKMITSVYNYEIKFSETSNDVYIYWEDENSNKFYSSLLDGNVVLIKEVEEALKTMHFGIDYKLLNETNVVNYDILKYIYYTTNKEAPLYTFYKGFTIDNEHINDNNSHKFNMSHWLTYASKNIFKYYVYKTPIDRYENLNTTKIPFIVDDYIKDINETKRVSNLSCIYNYKTPRLTPINFSMIINILNVLTDKTTPDIVWNYVNNYNKTLNRDNNKFIDDLIISTIKYYNNYVLGKNTSSLPTKSDKNIIRLLANELEMASNLPEFKKLEGEDLVDYINNIIRKIGLKYVSKDKDILRDRYFIVLNKIILGNNNNGKLGYFIAMYGIKNTIKLLYSRCGGLFFLQNLDTTNIIKDNSYGRSSLANFKHR